MKYRNGLLTWNWTLIATGLLCTALILWLGQWTLSALYAQVQLARQPDQPVRRWPWRRTVCGYLAVWLMFAITFGASGLFRHVTWLLTDKQPMYQSNREAETAYFKILSVANIVETSLFDSANNVEQVRAKLDSKLMENGSKPVEEDFDLTFFGNASKKVEKVVIISRDLHLLSSPKFLLMDASGKYDGNAMSNLTQTLSGLDAKYPIKR